MTGLMRKDLYCLRKNLITFFAVTIGVIVLSVLFVISAQSGNVAKGIEEMMLENTMSEEEFLSLFKVAVCCVLCLPLAFLTMVVECFKEDYRAGFSKVLLSMPLKNMEIVGSRYISCLIFTLLGMLGSSVAGVCVALVSDTFAFEKLFPFSLAFCAVLLIYMSFCMFMLYLFGAEKADLIQCVPFIILFALAIVFFQVKVAGMTEAEMDLLLESLLEQLKNFSLKSGVRFLIASLCCMTVSFLGACSIVKGRRGKS